MYTLKIRYHGNPKVYHFASMRKVAFKEWRVMDSKGDYVDVIVVGFENGISPLATKWRTGSPVTPKQRDDYPWSTVESKVVDEGKVTHEQFYNACMIISKVQQDCPDGMKLGVSISGNLYAQFNRDDSSRTEVVSSSWCNEVLEKAYFDPKQKEIQEIRKEMEGLSARLKELES